MGQQSFRPGLLGITPSSDRVAWCFAIGTPSVRRAFAYATLSPKATAAMTKQPGASRPTPPACPHHPPRPRGGRQECGNPGTRVRHRPCPCSPDTVNPESFSAINTDMSGHDRHGQQRVRPSATSRGFPRHVTHYLHQDGPSPESPVGSSIRIRRYPEPEPGG